VMCVESEAPAGIFVQDHLVVTYVGRVSGASASHE
jgi:hypothetical protein